MTSTPADKLASLKVKRSSTKASITRIKTYIETKAENLLFEELECRLGLLEAYFKQVLAIQDSIEGADPEETNGAAFCEIEDTYCILKSKILTMMGERKKHDSVSVCVDESSKSSPYIPSIASKSNLPKLQLPQFSGHYIEYTNFMNTFKLMVDSNKTLTNIEKFVHLRSCLKGEALVTIQALEVNVSNYVEALKLLECRYNNKYLIFEAHLNHLFNVPATSKAAAISIRKVVDHVNVHLKAMQSLASSNDILNAFVIHIVKGRLDQQSRSKWEESLKVDQLPTWTEFSEFLQRRCQVIEGNEFREVMRSNPTSSARVSSKASLAVYKQPKQSCSICNRNDHLIHKCSTFVEMPVMDRFTKVKQLGLCINCLHKGHSVKSCLSSRCRICSLPHHSLLHRYNTTLTLSANASVKDPEPTCNFPQTSASNNSTFSQTPASLHASGSHSCGDQVILATAIINVKNKVGKFIPVRVLLDSASQLNLMTESLAHKLQLSSKGIQAKYPELVILVQGLLVRPMPQ